MNLACDRGAISDQNDPGAGWTPVSRSSASGIHPASSPKTYLLDDSRQSCTSGRADRGDRGARHGPGSSLASSWSSFVSSGGTTGLRSGGSHGRRDLRCLAAEIFLQSRPVPAVPHHAGLRRRGIGGSLRIPPSEILGATPSRTDAPGSIGLADQTRRIRSRCYGTLGSAEAGRDRPIIIHGSHC